MQAPLLLKHREAILPLGMNRERAAAYVGMSAAKFDELVAEGLMPRPKTVGRRRIWSRYALDAAFEALPDGEERNPLDDNAAWGQP